MTLSKISSMMTTNITDEFGGPFDMNSVKPSDRNGIDNIVKARRPGFRGTITATVNGAPKRLKVAVNAKDRFRPSGTNLRPGMSVSTMPKLASTKKQEEVVIKMNRAKNLLYKETKKESYLGKNAGKSDVIFRGTRTAGRSFRNKKSIGNIHSKDPEKMSGYTKLLLGLGGTGLFAGGLSTISK